MRPYEQAVHLAGHSWPAPDFGWLSGRVRAAAQSSWRSASSTAGQPRGVSGPLTHLSPEHSNPLWLSGASRGGGNEPQPPVTPRLPQQQP